MEPETARPGPLARKTRVDAGPVGVLSVSGTPADLLQLVRARITGLVSFTAAAGYLVAGGGSDLVRLLWLVVGTFCLSGGSNALNQVVERREDARMERTQDRPVARGRMSPASGALVGGGLTVLGTAVLLWGVNLLTTGLALSAAAIYLLAYSPLKLRSPAALWVGAVSGALPILGGWTAATGSVDLAGLALFAILFLWQIPHFLALGWMYRGDYRRAGYAVLPVVDDGDRSGQVATLTALLLLPVGMLPGLAASAGWIYLGVAAVGGYFYLQRAGTFALAASAEPAGGGEATAARRLFHASLIYLPLLLTALLVDTLAPGLPVVEPLQLPHLNAGLNAAALGALGMGAWFITGGREVPHRRAMLTAAAASAAFLVSYLVYHAEVGSVPYRGTGWIQLAYRGVLVSHAVLAIAVVPMVLVTIARGVADRRPRHRRLARWTLPVWLYVSASGLVVYAMLYLL